MKKNIFLALGAVAMTAAASAIAVNHSAKNSVEVAAWSGNLTLKVHGAMGGVGDWGTLGQLTYHSDSNQYEGVFYLSKDTVFGLQVFQSGSQINWIAYRSELSTNFNSATGKDSGNIVAKADGVYQFWISAKIEDYGDHHSNPNGYYIWQESSYSSGINKLGTGPYFKISTDGGAHWSDETSTKAAWDNSSHRYKISRHLNKGDKFKLTDGSKYLGYNAELGGDYETDSDGNIIIKKTATYSFYLGASYWFYGDPSYGWIGNHSSDDTSKTYYRSYADFTQSAADEVNDFVAEYLRDQGSEDYTKYAEGTERKQSCASKYSAASEAYADLSPEAVTLFTTGQDYAADYAHYLTWEESVNNSGNAKIVSAVGRNKGANGTAIFAGLSVLGIAIGGAMIFLAKRRKEI